MGDACLMDGGIFFLVNPNGNIPAVLEQQQLIRGNEINSTYANYSSSKSNVVGLNDSNPWGFFDMHGNVYEWTADWFSSAYPNGNQVLTQLDPLRALQKVARGGSWKFGVNTLRSAKRSPDSPNARNEWVGFRLAHANHRTSNRLKLHWSS